MDFQITKETESPGTKDGTYDRETEIKEFDESKSGVKGLVDSGVKKVPRMFHCGQQLVAGTESTASDSKLSVPVIDLGGQRKETVTKIRSACREWGFFQVTNHGIPVNVLDEMIDGIRRFHDQDTEVRKQFYDRDNKKKFMYYSNTSLYRDKFANWRDTVGFSMAPDIPKPEELPDVCR